MTSRRSTVSISLALCAAATIGLGACAEPGEEEEEKGVEVAALSTGSGCSAVPSGSGWSIAPVTSGNRVVVTSFVVRPDRSDLDAVVGLANGAPDGFSDLAAAVRFRPDGTVDVRSGGVYRADAVVPYQAGGFYNVRVIVDFSTRTYSVLFDGSSGFDPVEVARGYQFRTEQGAVASLDHVGAIVDSALGTVEVCELWQRAPQDLAYVREGAFALAPFADKLAISDGGSTAVIDAAGQTETRIVTGGALAAGAGRIHIASVSGDVLRIDTRDPALQPMWNRTYTVPAGLVVGPIGVTSPDQLTVALVDPTNGSTAHMIQVLASTGAQRWSTPMLGRVGLAQPGTTMGFVTATYGDGTVTVAKYNRNAVLLWTTSFTADASVEVVALDATGRVLFGGHYDSPVSFGGPTLDHWIGGGELDANTYLVKLTAAGDHQFTRRVGFSYLKGLAVSPTRIAVSGEVWTQLRYQELQLRTPSGRVIVEHYSPEAFGDRGRSGTVALGAGSRVYWNQGQEWPGVWETWPFMLALDL